LLAGVIFDIDKVEKEEEYYIVTVDLTCRDKQNTVCYFIFERKSGEWVLNRQCVEQAVYAGNGIGGTGSTLLDIMQILS
jgi:tRNA-binding EMAP/Myf-like protein